ncbi:stalk domain-containing protein [Paenibacillus sacheonensis]|uniref:Copper amine oxidase n=1 Tax=Paenibacillus sacheonensis TaxID=742054 RepID=A0A7X4YK97_9BACL|nr:stalk domain-containing protein [Paenibacillus sacheonensis]MBM7563698.1 sugar lactone lactonase YvrE [Paenibacillus sacheonensis]NBC67946.1 copper amine oxidase [Paenibacillus sacheonensis]
MKKRMKFAVLAAASAAVLGMSANMGYAAAGNGNDAVMKLKPLYEVRTIAGSGAYGLLNGSSKASAFREPTSLLYNSGLGTFLVTDTNNQQLRVIAPGTASTAAGFHFEDDDGSAPLGSLLDGAADKAAFNAPSGLARDAAGNVYVADAGNHAIRKIDVEGSVTTIAGNGLFGAADGKGAAAEFNHPMDVAVSDDGVVYVADTLNHAIRRIKDGIVTTLNAHSSRIVEYFPGSVAAAGDYADGPIAKALFNEPSGLALDGKGNLYVSDTGNDVIRYMDFAADRVTTVAGLKAGASISYGANEPYAAGGYADGAASVAKFRSPRGLDVTPEGGLLIADSLNHVVRYLLNGTVTTIAGTPDEVGRVDGIAGSALLHHPTDVAWLGGGAIGIADSGSNTIRVAAPYQVPAGVKADETIHLLYGTQVLEGDVDPMIKNGVTYVPVRVLAEKLGYNVHYAGGQTSLRLGTTAYTVKAASSVIGKTVQGSAPQTVRINAVPFNAGGRLYLPVRFFAEELGLDVQWLSDVRAVLLRNKQF